MFHVGRRRMSNLAAQFTGKGEGFVVSPRTDLRYLFDDVHGLQQNVMKRGLDVDVHEVHDKYTKWWNLFNRFKDGQVDKALARDSVEGLLMALRLPNRLDSVAAEAVPTEHPCASTTSTLRSLGHLKTRDGMLFLSGKPVSMLDALQRDWTSLFSDAHLMSPSHFARCAVVEGVNAKLSDFLTFGHGSSSYYLIGHGLISLLSPFLRAKFSLSNKLPIVLQSVGASFHRTETEHDEGRQRTKHCVLALCDSEDAASSWRREASELVRRHLSSNVPSSVLRVVSARDLHLYESSAHVFSAGSSDVVRVSLIGDYISGRLNISFEDGSLCHMVYLETDLSSVLNVLFEM